MNDDSWYHRDGPLGWRNGTWVWLTIWAIAAFIFIAWSLSDNVGLRGGDGGGKGPGGIKRDTLAWQQANRKRFIIKKLEIRARP